MTMIQDKIDKKIAKLEATVTRLQAELPERVFAVYSEGLADGAKVGGKPFNPRKLYAAALKRIAKRQGK